MEQNKYWQKALWNLWWNGTDWWFRHSTTFNFFSLSCPSPPKSVPVATDVRGIYMRSSLPRPLSVSLSLPLSLLSPSLSLPSIPLSLSLSLYRQRLRGTNRDRAAWLRFYSFKVKRRSFTCLASFVINNTIITESAAKDFNTALKFTGKPFFTHLFMFKKVIICGRLGAIGN